MATVLTAAARARAIHYVASLIERYRALLANPRGYHVGVAAKIAHLRGELAEMQGVSPEGDRLCRQWAFLTEGL